MRKEFLFTKKIKDYQGTYIAVVGEKVVASGKNAKEAYTFAKKVLGPRRNVEGVYYIPQKKDLLTALCVFRISS